MQLLLLIKINEKFTHIALIILVDMSSSEILQLKYLIYTHFCSFVGSMTDRLSPKQTHDPPL